MRIVPFEKGYYTATITVTQGAPALRGVPQTVTLRYEVCGLEKLAAMFTGGIGIVCMVTGLVIGSLTVASLRKRM